MRNFEQKIANGEVVTNMELQRALACHWMSLCDRLISGGKAKRIAWITESVDGALCRPDLDIEQDSKEVERITQEVRGHVIRAWTNKIDDGGLPVAMFHRQGKRTGIIWKQEWIEFQLNNNRLVLDGDHYRSGQDWHESR